ncbi:MAG: hypothetical protein JSV00_07880, partial [bacterium]
DPDQPDTSAGLAWSVILPPAGQLSAQSGTYPDAVITYDAVQVSAGTTDSFWYYVTNADGEVSNTAEVRIAVTAQPVTGQRLYFMAKDDQYRTHLWYYDGSSPIATVPGSAQALSADDLEWFQKGIPYQSEIHFIVADTSGENNRSWSYNPSAGTFRYYPQIEGVGDLVEAGSLLYASGYAAGTNTYSLWELGSGGWTRISSTTGVISTGGNLAVLGNRIYFAGAAGAVNLQLFSWGAGGLVQETSTADSLWPWNLTVCNGRLYFNGSVGTAAPIQYLWALDGVSPAATVTGSVTNPQNMICFDNALYFTAMGPPSATMPVQLWSMDGSDVLTRWTSNATYDFMGLYTLTFPAIAGSTLYMRGTDDTPTNWLWAIDGTSPISTVPGSAGLYPSYTGAFGDRIFFASSYVNPPPYIDQLGSYDPGTGQISALSNAPSPGFYARCFVVYPP